MQRPNINADMAAQFEKINVRVLNNKTETFEMMSLELEQQSKDGSVLIPIPAYAT